MIHAEHHAPMRKAAAVLALLLVGLLLAWLLPTPPWARGIAGYAPLHTLLETIAVVIACLVFAIGWNAYSRELPHTIVLLACAFLGVALLDFSHALSYVGMPDYVTPSDPEKAINFWLSARLLAALALLAAALAPWQPFALASSRYAVLAAVLGVTALAHGLFLFFPAAMPRTFVAGSGLTGFKIGAEVVLIGLYLACAAVLWQRMRKPQSFNAAALFVAAATMALSEFFFTLYASVTDVYNLMGHLYKVVAYLFLYRAVFVETVERPYGQLRAAQAQLRATLQTIPDLLWLKDLEGVYLDCNPGMERRFGRPRAQIVGRCDDDFGSREQAQQYREQDRQALNAGRLVISEEWLDFVADGYRGLFEVIKTPMHDAEGRLAGVLGIARDITAARQGQQELRDSEQRLQQLNATLDARVQERTRELEAALAHLQQAQGELVRSEKMASLGALVAGVAHELNTPVGNAVMVASTLSGRQREFEAGMAGGLRRSTLDAFLASTREVSEVLERNLQRAAELIGSFKQIAVDQSSYQRRRFELGEVVQEIALALSPTLRRSGVRLVDEVAPGLAMDSFPGPLGQVLINLVNNAVLHAFEGQAAGTVRIGAEQLAGDRVHLWVRDDGRGIAREHQRQIFDPFFTTRLGQGGSGLGLHIAYTLVTGLLGGRIDVQSVPGQGAEFRIEMPCIAPQAVSPP